MPLPATVVEHGDRVRRARAQAGPTLNPNSGILRKRVGRDERSAAADDPQGLELGACRSKPHRGRVGLASQGRGSVGTPRRGESKPHCRPQDRSPDPCLRADHGPETPSDGLERAECPSPSQLGWSDAVPIATMSSSPPSGRRRGRPKRTARRRGWPRRPRPSLAAVRTRSEERRFAGRKGPIPTESEPRALSNSRATGFAVLIGVLRAGSAPRSGSADSNRSLDSGPRSSEAAVRR